MDTGRGSNDDLHLSDSFWLHVLVMTHTGCFPLDMKRLSTLHRVLFLLYSTIIMTLFTIFQIAEVVFLIQNIHDMDQILQCLPQIFIQIVTLTKVVIFWRNADGIRWLLNHLDGPGWARDHKAARSLCRTIPLSSALFAAQPVLVGLLWLISPYYRATEDFRFPVKTWLPEFSPTSPWKHVWLFIQVSVISMTGVSETLMNTMICGFLAHARAQLIVLREALEKIGIPQPENSVKTNVESHKTPLEQLSDACAKKVYKRHQVLTQNSKMRLKIEIIKKNPSLNHPTSEEMKKDFVKCMRHYDIILKFVKKVEGMFTWGIFFQFTISAIIICSAAFQLNTAQKGSIEFYFSALFTVGMLNELIIFCYFGNTVINESSLLLGSIYDCNWTSTDKTFRRFMIIFGERTKMPVTVMAGKFFRISIPTFFNVIKSSYSYYALIEGLRVK